MREFSDIEAIILDKDGVFVDFHRVWLRIIAYRAQLIAERAAETSDVLVKIRTACIRAMGVDEDMETIDPYGPCSLPGDSVRLALATALFVTQNEMDASYTWQRAFGTIDACMQEVKDTMKVVEMSEPIAGSVEKIKELKQGGFTIGIYTSDSQSNTEKTMEKFEIADVCSAMQAGELKTKENYLDLCSTLAVNPAKTLLVTDSPVDLQAGKAAGAQTIAVLTGIIDKDSNLDYVRDLADEVLGSLAELEIDKISNSKKLAA